MIQNQRFFQTVFKRLFHFISIKLQVGDENFFIRTRFSEIRDGQAVLDISEPLYKLQRREFYRVKLVELASSEFEIFLSKSMLESVQIAIEESVFPRYDSSGIGNMTLHNSPITFPMLFI